MHPAARGETRSSAVTNPSDGLSGQTKRRVRTNQATLYTDLGRGLAQTLDLLAALPADTNVIVMSDHGGHDRNHGTDQAEDMGIVWLAAGPQIKPGLTLTQPLTLLDTAPTLARLLGLAPHPEWEGRCVDEAFA